MRCRNGRSGHHELRPALPSSSAELGENARHFRTRHDAEKRAAGEISDAPSVLVYARLWTSHRRRHGDLLLALRWKKVQVSEVSFANSMALGDGKMFNWGGI
jgi:hypothetical protein